MEGSFSNRVGRAMMNRSDATKLYPVNYVLRLSNGMHFIMLQFHVIRNAGDFNNAVHKYVVYSHRNSRMSLKHARNYHIFELQ